MTLGMEGETRAGQCRVLAAASACSSGVREVQLRFLTGAAGLRGACRGAAFLDVVTEDPGLGQAAAFLPGFPVPQRRLSPSPQTSQGGNDDFSCADGLVPFAFVPGRQFAAPDLALTDKSHTRLGACCPRLV